MANDIADHAPSCPRVVVIGGSAGAIEVVKTIVSKLPAGFPASVLVVVHLSPSSPSALPAILSRATGLTVTDPHSDEPLRPATVYVAPPDCHLVIRGDRVWLTKGPRENRVRPAVDVLFRSAARECRDRAIGVIVSGGLDDGAAGLAQIKAAGGIAIVQDPNEASSAGMPTAAIERVDVDLVAPAATIAHALVQAVIGDVVVTGRRSAAESLTVKGPVVEDFELSCPECAGVLREHEEAGTVHYECMVGHRFAEQTMLDAQAEGAESALWMAVRALEERVQLAERMADRFRQREQHVAANRLAREAHDAALRAEVVRRAIGTEVHEAPETR